MAAIVFPKRLGLVMQIYFMSRLLVSLPHFPVRFFRGEGQVRFGIFGKFEYYAFFQPLEVTRHTLLSDKMGFRFFELPKLPAEISGNDRLQLWLSLFKAETGEELEVPVMSQAINAYDTITACEQVPDGAGS